MSNAYDRAINIARNMEAKAKARQGEINRSIYSVAPILDKNELFDLNSFGHFTDAEMEHEMQVISFESLQMEIAEEIVSCNRTLAKKVMEQGAEAFDTSPELLELRGRLKVLSKKRDDTEAKLKVLFAEQRTSQRAALSSLDFGQSEHSSNGLVPLRHPNRDFFLADLFDYAIKDDGASMEAPIFTLSTKPDLSLWEWESKDKTKSVKVTPSVLGRATQHDKDVLIYVISQITEALNRGRDDAKNRTVRFTAYDYFVATNRGVSGHDYDHLEKAFERLAGTRITTDIKTGGERVREGFGIIDSWRIITKSRDNDRMEAVEITLSRWLYNAVKAFEVLTIHPDYFRLRRPLARRLYELARKHCGHQTSWSIGLALLRDKSGSKSPLNGFKRLIQEIEAENNLPQYRFTLGQNNMVTFYARSNARLIEGISKRVEGT